MSLCRISTFQPCKEREALMRNYNQLTQTENYQNSALRKANIILRKSVGSWDVIKAPSTENWKRNLWKRDCRAVQAHQFTFERHESRPSSNFFGGLAVDRIFDSPGLEPGTNLLKNRANTINLQDRSKKK